MEGQQPSFLTQSAVLTKRSFVNMYRDLGYYWLRFGIYVALCLCCGTIFYDIGHSYGSIQVTRCMSHCRLSATIAMLVVPPCLCADRVKTLQARGSMLMFVTAFLTFMAIGGFPSFVEDMKVLFSCLNLASCHSISFPSHYTDVFVHPKCRYSGGRG
jgi:spore maturation protein SpmB